MKVLNTLLDTDSGSYRRGVSPLWKSGLYYCTDMGASGTINMATGVAYAVPIWHLDGASASTIGIQITTATPNSLVRLGIYNSDDTGYPSSLIIDAGTALGTTTGAREITFGANQILGGLLSYMVVASQGVGTLAVSSVTGVGVWPLGSTTIAANPPAGYSATITGALPSIWNTTPVTRGGTIPLCFLKAA